MIVIAEDNKTKQSISREELEQTLLDYGIEGAVLLSDCDDAVIGVTVDGQVVYDYKEMVLSLMRDGMESEVDAMDWIDYNTVPSLGFIPKNERPVIIINLKDEGLL